VLMFVGGCGGLALHFELLSQKGCKASICAGYERRGVCLRVGVSGGVAAPPSIPTQT
jgi:hypothetical protein